MGQSNVIPAVNKDVEKGENLQKNKSTNQSDGKTENNENDEQGKINQTQINELLKLLRREDSVDDIRKYLSRNKRLLTYKYWKNNKVRSILHIAKYDSKRSYEMKQKIVNAIVDVGYQLFNFPAQEQSFRDNCYALFFVAAKGDYEKLQKIVTFFRENHASKIHDTIEGDTVISFMIKFGDYFQDNYLKCFQFMIEEGIDMDRVDYYKKNIEDIISLEITFLEKTNAVSDYITKLHQIRDIAKTDFKSKMAHATEVQLKQTLFDAIIKDDKSFKELSLESLLDSDDGENTLLQLAIIKNNFKITKELLDKGANPNHVVKERNEEHPLVLAAKLSRDEIFEEVLKAKDLKIVESVFAKFVQELKPKFLNSLLESKALNVDIKYNGKTPLYYAIMRKNKNAIQSLIQRGSHITPNYLQYMNPNDLEEYLNSCIRDDNFADDLEESNYKSLLVFDFFINSSKSDKKLKTDNNNSEKTLLMSKQSPNYSESFDSEIKIIRWIGDNKRLKHLLEHPLVYIFVNLKWHYVKYYYFYFLTLKSIFYISIAILVYVKLFNLYVVIPILIIQCMVVFYNYLEYKFNFRRYTLHFVLEILLLICIVVLWVLNFINIFLNSNLILDVITQISSFIIIFSSLSILMTIGYHMNLSKWMAMGKRVFKNFMRLLLFFMIPIIAFATSFNLLASVSERPKQSETDNSDFSSLWGAIFRTFIMLGGDIGDKKFTVLSGYLMFLIFTVGMAIILLNFWTGVAVSDIKEIEEQSTIMAFKNVMVFIESTEKLYQFLIEKILHRFPFGRYNSFKKLQSPFLKSRLSLEHNKRKFQYGIDLFINLEKPFKNNKFFEDCKLEHDIISKIKTLFEDKDVNMEKILKAIDNVMIRLDRIEKIVHNSYKSKQTY